MGLSLVDGIQGCSKVLGCFFVFVGMLIIDGWVSIRSRLNAPICKIQCAFWKMWVFFAVIWCSDVNHTFRY